MPDIVISASGGRNVLIRPMVLPVDSPASTVAAASVEVYWRTRKSVDESFGAWILHGVVAPIAEGDIQHNPDEDGFVEVSLIPVSATGTVYAPTPDEGVRASTLVQRDSEAPIVGQVGASTADLIVLAVDPPNRFTRKRKLRTSPNADMSDVSVTIKEFEINQVPRLINLSRVAAFVADFTWAGGDPATHGFTKNGSGTTEAGDGGWRINTLGTDAETYYSYNAWPSGAFDDGFTLELSPPAITDSDGHPLPNLSVLLRVGDGTFSYDLLFDAENVTLNNSDTHAFGSNKIRLVVAEGGETADLWVGNDKVEEDFAAASIVEAGLFFGDLAENDDADVIWKSFAFAFTPQDVKLPETVYVGVAQSGGGAFGPESEIQPCTFASEGGSSPGSIGDFDLVPRDKYSIG